MVQCSAACRALCQPDLYAMSMQGAIYELKKPDGKDSGQLLKVLKFKAVLPITGNDIGKDMILAGNSDLSCSWSTFTHHGQF